MPKVAVSILAHPDDAEFLCAGTMIRLMQEKGWEAHVVSMTPGDCGSHEYNVETISRMRRAEGAAAAALVKATYHCLEERDLRVFYNERTLEKITRILRAVRADIVFTHSPSDYMLDHEMTSTTTRAACFAAAVPNFLPETMPSDRIPHLYYCDAAEGKDPLGHDVQPTFCIDVSRVIDRKAQMLACHESQRNWLMKHHGMDHYVQTMRDWTARRGQGCGVAFAEGFRQHLGHSYPQDNLLLHLLGG